MILNPPIYMQVFLYPIRKRGCYILLWLLPMLIMGFSGMAQHKNRLPDSISTSVEEVPATAVDTVKTTYSTAPKVDTSAPIAEDSSSSLATSATEGQADSAIFRTLPDSVRHRYQRDPHFAYANDPDYWKKAKAAKPKHYKFFDWLFSVLASKGFRVFLYFLLGAILLFIIFKIISENNLRLFYRSAARLRQPGDTGERTAPEDLDKQLEEALQAADYRLAIRCWFLKSLYWLDERQLIRYHAQASNQDYVQQFSGYPQGQRFRFLTGIYEHVWYGGIELNRQQYEQIAGYYRDFHAALPGSSSAPGSSPSPASSASGMGGVAGVLLLSLLVLGSACNTGKNKYLNKRVTLWRGDKIPYGTYVAYHGLSHIFPDAYISTNDKSPSHLLTGSGKKAYIIITGAMFPDETEINSIMNFVGEGNHVFISSFIWGDSLLHALNVQPAFGGGLFKSEDSLRLSVYNPVSFDSLSFAYPGMSHDSWVSSLDSQYATVLGRDAKGHPDFIKFSYKGGGSLLLHFAPMAFTNFFLLHKNNIDYYNNALSYIPVDVRTVIWDDYFRYASARNQRGAYPILQHILSNDSLRWGFWLLLLLFALLYLFDSKKKQRTIPLIAPLRNNSLDFVKTIGRLYYQRRDNYNLAAKMTAHFQDHIRSRYNFTASFSDPSFAERLAYKTGISKESLEFLVADIRRFQEGNALTDWEILEFNRKMEEFYKSA